jgi:uncharacterized protein (DUF3084 family)
VSRGGSPHDWRDAERPGGDAPGVKSVVPIGTPANLPSIEELLPAALDRAAERRRLAAGGFILPRSGESTSAALRRTQAALAAFQADLTRVEQERDEALDDRDGWREVATTLRADCEAIARAADLARAELASAHTELERLRARLGHIHCPIDNGQEPSA